MGVGGVTKGLAVWTPTHRDIRDSEELSERCDVQQYAEEGA